MLVALGTTTLSFPLTSNPCNWRAFPPSARTLWELTQFNCRSHRNSPFPSAVHDGLRGCHSVDVLPHPVLKFSSRQIAKKIKGIIVSPPNGLRRIDTSNKRQGLTSSGVNGGALDDYGMLRRLRLLPLPSPDVDDSLATASARRPSDLYRLSPTMRLHRRSGGFRDGVFDITVR